MSRDKEIDMRGDEGMLDAGGLNKERQTDWLNWASRGFAAYRAKLGEATDP